MIGRPWRTLLVVLVLISIALLAYAAWRSPQPDERLVIRPAQATAVARAAAVTVGQSSVGEATAVVVSAGGALIAAAPAASAGPVEVRLPGGTPAAGRVAADPVTGIAILDVARTRRSTLDLGSSESLVPGQQLIVAPGGGAENVRVTYVGRNTVAVESLAVEQSVLELALPEGAAVTQGAVLDRDGKLVGVIVPTRQSGAAPGRAFAVPIESAHGLLIGLGLAPTPTPPAGGLPGFVLGRPAEPRSARTATPELPIADD